MANQTKRRVARMPGPKAVPGRDIEAPTAHEIGKRRPEVRLDGLTSLAGYLIRQAQLWVFADFNTTLAPLDIRPAQYSMLVVIRDNPGLSQMALSEVLGISRSGIIPPLDELQSRKLLKRTAASDRRTHALRLTTEGKALLAHADSLVQQHEQRLMDKVGARGHQQLLNVLEVFGRDS
ncbi:transcriptional regulator [Bradyrhizobium sp. SSBR45G]|uniref:MarR family winged helix-turn-helix transcriptional regulator n=1 Tax=unclassified Bradyrhizobium TaxID=2631580 RepID=UPI0023429A39|nr:MULTISPECIES: MarR family transcriptional regulator [unclassified Bradyrhizobium]GLH81912.1 transcriptional regulator [Bradyrhizobium sp. SSBR45G]GLH89391.1 transcriptional regulator [Bradyrhizobium sp. SSBR45R]